MKKCTFILFLFPTLLNSQVYKAGDILPFYYDINPDTLIKHIGCWKCPKKDSVYINIFGNALPDFKVESVGFDSYTNSDDYIHIVPMNSNVFIGWGRIDSACGTYGWPTPVYQCWVTQVTKPLGLGDTINNSSAVWKNQPLDLINISALWGFYKNVQDFVGPSDKYIQVKYQTSSDTAYGWIRVQCPDNHNCYVKDYSASANFAGIKESNKTSLNIFPNPASDILNISNKNNEFNDSEIEITNYLGHTVFKISYTTTIDVSKLASGIYTLKIITSNSQNFYSKFVKE